MPKITADKSARSAAHAALETILRLARAAEYKDEETGDHIRRISEFAAAIGRRLGLSGEAEETLFYASPLHDVGKIGIPDHILLKPGKLDADEWEIMKTILLLAAVSSKVPKQKLSRPLDKRVSGLSWKGDGALLSAAPFYRRANPCKQL